MSEAGWISIITLIMSGVGSMFAAWIVFRQKQLDQKMTHIAGKTEVVSKDIGETKEMVNGQMSSFKAMMRELMAEKVISARAAGKDEEQETGRLQMQEKADAAQHVRDTAIIAAQELKQAAIPLPSAAPAAKMVLEPQDVELNVAGTLTQVEKDEAEATKNRLK